MHKFIASNPLAIVIDIIHPQASGCLQPQPEPQRPDVKLQLIANKPTEMTKLIPHPIKLETGQGL